MMMMTMITQAVTLVFRSVLALASTIGDLPPESVRDMLACSDEELARDLSSSATVADGDGDHERGADVVRMVVPHSVPQRIYETIHAPDPDGRDGGEVECDLGTETCAIQVQIQGMPAEHVKPMLRFSLRDGRWTFQRAVIRGRPLPSLKRVEPFTLMCPVCSAVDLTTMTDPAVHCIMASWVGTRLLVCDGCKERVRSTAHLRPGACFCCTSTDRRIGVYQRQDASAIVLLCDQCTQSQWLRVIEDAGILFHRCAFPQPRHRDLVISIVARSPMELYNAYMQYMESKKRNTPDGSPPPVSSPTRIAPQSPALTGAPQSPALTGAASSPVHHHQCCIDEPAAFCAVSGCSATVCEQCLTQRYGQLSAMYRFPVKLWRCSAH